MIEQIDGVAQHSRFNSLSTVSPGLGKPYLEAKFTWSVDAAGVTLELRKDLSNSGKRNMYKSEPITEGYQTERGDHSRREGR